MWVLDGCRHPCVFIFKGATSGPSQKPPWKGIEFLQPSDRLQWDTGHLASGQAATPAPVGGAPRPQKVGGPGVASKPWSTKQKAQPRPVGLRRESARDPGAGCLGSGSHAAAPELTGKPLPLVAKMSRGSRLRSSVIGGERNSRPAHCGHVARPAQLDNAAPGPSAPLPPRPAAAAAAPSPFVQDGGAGGAASWAAAAAALRDPRAARPPAKPAR